MCLPDHWRAHHSEKAGRESKGSTAKADTVKGDQASLAFRAIDKDNSGFVDRAEFLQFTR